MPLNQYVITSYSIHYTKLYEIPAAVADTRLMAYQSSVRERIFALKRYPKQARRLHHEGSVTVRFWINGDGTMQRFELIEKSGLATLDGATEQLFEHIPGFEVRNNFV